MKQDMIVILDLGSHENTVLARAIRALGVYSEIYPHDITVEELKALPNVKGIIINGGPNNVIDGVAIDVNPGIYSIGIPVMAAGHDKALCEVKLNEFSSDMEAIKESVKTFVFDTCKAEANWNMTNFVNDQIELVRRQVGDRKVLLALSGGVDSSVVAALLLKAIGDKLVCVHVNHGLMRKGESENVVEIFKNQLNANLIYKDVTDRFLDKLAGVADPEEKRKIIGGEFIRVFEEEARKLDGIDFLYRGKRYKDSQDGEIPPQRRWSARRPEIRIGRTITPVVQGRSSRLRSRIGLALRNGLPPAVPRSRFRSALLRCYHTRQTGSGSRSGCHPA